MDNFNFFTHEELSIYCNPRKGETKFGEALTQVNSFEALEQNPAKYVIVGIPEDIGVQANLGKPGTKDAWKEFLKAFLNIQINPHNQPENCIILGQIDCESFLKEAEDILQKEENAKDKLGPIVSEIDEIVAEVVAKIVATNKIPVIIGGGHNNAYGNIKGVSQALDRPINVINIDAHTDLRLCDYRHSGNGFSYAIKDGYLNRYNIIGLHKNYTPYYIFDEMEASKKINYSLFEEYIHLTTIDKLIKFKASADFVKNQFGLEIDCDAIENFGSSAMSPTGFSLNEVRSFIKICRKQEVLYMHLCEAAPNKSKNVGKALSYFVSDFIRDDAN